GKAKTHAFRTDRFRSTHRSDRLRHARSNAPSHQAGRRHRPRLGKSQLTLAGSAPFHIKFSIRETINPQSDRHAEVEEYWVAPEKCRRTIQSPAFSQTLIVNGSEISETDAG